MTQLPGSPKLGVVIGVPSVGWQSTLFLKSLMTLVPPLNTVINFKFIGTRRYGDPVRPVAEADNILVHEAIRDGAKYLLSIEEDVIPPPMGLRQLMATMGLRPESTVVAGIVTSKSIPPEPMIYREDGQGACFDFARGEIFEVASVHMGFTLIRLADLADVPAPLVPVRDYPEPGDVTEIRQFFKTSEEAAVDGRDRMSQDVHFSRLLRSAGKHIYADAGVNCGHFDLANGMVYGLRVMEKPKADSKAKVVNLGCGLDWDMIDGIRPLRVDIHEVNKPDFRADLRALPEHWTDTVDIVYSSNVLEHFDRYELPGVFAEMVRVARPGGEIRLRVPSFDWAMQQVAQGNYNGKVIDVIWGGRSVPAVGPYPEMYHKMGISRALMAGLAKQHNLVAASQRIEHQEIHRMFKPPLSEEVRAWLADPSKDFDRRFILPADQPEGQIAAAEAAVTVPTEEPKPNGAHAPEVVAVSPEVEAVPVSV
ncbi:MAG: hypothetical protein QG671_3504 [Actinomycetota bacterium]|nr:hypothetical protein [Actinomycetota bacterium]